MRSTFLSFFFALLFFSSKSQDLSGIWKGYFITSDGEQYKLEFQVDKNGKLVRGVSYSYLDKRFYGKATMTGNWSSDNKVLQIQELRTTEVRNYGGGGTCLMNYKLLFSSSGKEQFLEGSYVGKSEDRINPENNGTWGDCGSGTVYLRRVTQSEFVLEPFIKQKPKSRTTPTPAPKPQNNTAKTKTKPPKSNTVRPSTRQPNVPLVKKDPMDTVVTRRSELPVTRSTVRVEIPPATRARKNELTSAVNVNNRQITVRLYDNGEIDNDTVTVYLDGVAIIKNQRLTASPLTHTITFEEEGDEHVLIMVAENLGKIPPNTSLMIVQDGDQRQRISITSTEQKNAMVRFRYKKSSTQCPVPST